jgi:hypothetical protein
MIFVRRVLCGDGQERVNWYGSNNVYILILYTYQKCEGRTRENPRVGKSKREGEKVSAKREKVGTLEEGGGEEERGKDYRCKRGCDGSL